MNWKIAAKIASGTLVLVIALGAARQALAQDAKSSLSQHGSARSIPDSGSKC